MAEQHEEKIVRRNLRTDRSDPATGIAEIVADLEERCPSELGATYRCIDGVLENIFANPPSEEAQMQVIFTYEGYRVTVDQDGSARFVKVD